MDCWTEKDRTVPISYNGHKIYIAVEHPGLIKNYQRALQTIGGTDNLEKVYEDPSKRLPLSWRPDDFYSKCTHGDRTQVTNLLMKVHRRRRKSDGKEEFRVEVVGVCETTYRFQAMADFQYLPMKYNKDNTYESIYERIIIDRIRPMKEYMNDDVPLFLPPMAFSRSDRPCDFHYKQEMTHRAGYQNPDASRPPDMIGTVRQRRSIFTIFVNFGENIPTSPIPDAVEKTKSDFVDPNGEKVLRKLFDEKPLYLKVELEHRTGYRGEKLKTFLPAICFYWLDGPWRGQWNKFGFDPTKNVSAKIYQTIDFRIRQLRAGHLDIKAKRDTLKIYAFNQTFRNQKQNVKINLKSLDEEDTEDKGVQKMDKEIYYKFKPDKIPPQRMMYYPANYVEIVEVQQLLHENDGKEEQLTAEDGWCIKNFNQRCRDLMYAYLNRLLNAGDTVEHKFWRTKKKKRRIEKLLPENSEGMLKLVEKDIAGDQQMEEEEESSDEEENLGDELIKNADDSGVDSAGNIAGSSIAEGEAELETGAEEAEFEAGTLEMEGVVEA